uniref:Methylosome subunit pICln n=1 Tax=Lygus hesperus TaxID=30085 RepID=A0A0A9ZD01_LYGHE
MVVISSFSPPTEGIKHEQPATIVVMNDKELGKGTMYISQSSLSWVDHGSGNGFALEYPHISIHAVSRDLASYPRECLFVMLDTNVDFSDARPNGDSEDEGEDEITEFRFIPDDAGALDRMFQAMNECQLLNPDPNDSISEEEEDDEDGEEDEDEEYHDVDEGFLSRSNGVNSDDMEVEGQFDDAEDAGFQEN